MRAGVQTVSLVNIYMSPTIHHSTHMNKADPRVRKHLLKVPNSLVIEAPCKKSEYSRNPNFPYRLHPQFAIKVIPSLFEWSCKEGVWFL